MRDIIAVIPHRFSNGTGELDFFPNLGDNVENGM
jgi:hypothetical protein